MFSHLMRFIPFSPFSMQKMHHNYILVRPSDYPWFESLILSIRYDNQWLLRHNIPLRLNRPPPYWRPTVQTLYRHRWFCCPIRICIESQSILHRRRLHAKIYPFQCWWCRSVVLCMHHLNLFYHQLCSEISFFPSFPSQWKIACWMPSSVLQMCCCQV